MFNVKWILINLHDSKKQSLSFIIIAYCGDRVYFSAPCYLFSKFIHHNKFNTQSLSQNKLKWNIDQIQTHRSQFIDSLLHLSGLFTWKRKLRIARMRSRKASQQLKPKKVRFNFAQVRKPMECISFISKQRFNFTFNRSNKCMTSIYLLNDLIVAHSIWKHKQNKFKFIPLVFTADSMEWRNRSQYRTQTQWNAPIRIIAGQKCYTA